MERNGERGRQGEGGKEGQGRRALQPRTARTQEGGKFKRTSETMNTSKSITGCPQEMWVPPTLRYRAEHDGGSWSWAASREHWSGVTPRLPPCSAHLSHRSPGQPEPPNITACLNGHQSQNHTGNGLLEDAVQLTQADVTHGLSHQS